MKLESSIRTGEVLVAASMLVACAGFAYSIKLDISETRSEYRVTSKTLEIKQDSILETVGRLEGDVTSMRDELKENEKNDELLRGSVSKHHLLDEQRWK